MENKITFITISIIIFCFIIAIWIKGVYVTDTEKNIINQHMSWKQCLDLFKEE